MRLKRGQARLIETWFWLFLAHGMFGNWGIGNSFFQLWIWVGYTSNSDANSLIVLLPFTASIATFDLKSDVNVFLAISLPRLTMAAVSFMGSTILCRV